MKTIAIQKGLESLKSELELRGYKIVEQYNVTEAVSAYIYKTEDNINSVDAGNAMVSAVGDTYHQGIFSSLNTNFINNTVDSNQSILLINANNKEIDDIIYMIENRFYSPLF